VELLLKLSEPSPGKQISFWKNPAAWLQEKNLGNGYWIFFMAAFFFDAGFAIYFFLFNLYLLDLHFNERAMGLIGGSMTLGSLVGTLPAGLLARKIGLRSLLIFCFIAASLLQALRVICMWLPAQLGLAFLAGLATCSWGVCFLPAVARLTTEKSRTAGFSLIFSASIATSALGGVVCGYLPQWLKGSGIVMQPAAIKRLILLAALCSG
jgi:MFS family permease